MNCKLELPPLFLRCLLTVFGVALTACSILNEPIKSPRRVREDGGSSSGCSTCSALRCFLDSSGQERCAKCVPGSYGTTATAGDAACDDGEYCLWAESTPEPVCVDLCGPRNSCHVGTCYEVVDGPFVCIP